MAIQNMVHQKKREKKKALLLTKINILVNTKVTGLLKYLNLVLKMKEKIGLMSLIGEKNKFKDS